MANACCSIELEPRTLKGGQLNHAREEAADVAQKLKPHDATTIFIEGLRPVGSVKKMKQITEDEGEEEDHDDHVHDQDYDRVVKNAQIVETPCQCPCTCNASTVSVELDEKLIREPLSAPF